MQAAIAGRPSAVILKWAAGHPRRYDPNKCIASLPGQGRTIKVKVRLGLRSELLLPTGAESGVSILLVRKLSVE